ncbi:MAG: ATP-dependent RNA helicase HrpA [Gammaproteobacteria bacterium]|nr:ATP-dependent RNA helicase HrpA [Gammaproteobacteria bacterium]
MASPTPESSAVSFDPAAVMRRDVFRLRRLADKDPAAFAALLERSQTELAARLRSEPRIHYPEELPISAHAGEIRALLERHQVVVVAGETGSGKTTQLPKICLDAGYGRRGMIAHTQPRRLAARSVAARIADEMGVEPGAEVGYAVRFSDQTGPQTLVKLVTDGLLLTEIRRDRFLDNYDVVIVDEAHERSLNIDFLLGYLKRLLGRRRDLKLVITSATIDVEAFSRHFGDAPVVEVSGRGYPVEVRYAGGEQPEEERLIECLEDIETGPQGRARDVLVFQSGEREILDTARLLRDTFGDRMEILPLYARLAHRDQQRVFQPGKRRRVVLATNVAETSITVPNIGYVIDPGLARISRYSYRSKLQRLPVEAISQASANQRMGRCGRVAPGVCYRLYDEADFLGRPAFTDPEIRRTNLASVVLSMEAFGLGQVSRFPFLDPPEPGAVRDAVKLLEELGALREGKLTEVGRTMARLPVDPRLARMLVAADELRSLSEVLVIASGLAVQDPRERPLDKRGAADQAHAQHADERSDFQALLNLWQFHERTRQENTRAGARKALEKQFLSPARLREWRELHRQLLLAIRELGLRPNETPANYADIHRAVLAGSLSLIGLHEEKGSYQGPRNLRFRIFPGSGLTGRSPKWLMAGEIMETRRIYARCVAVVEPAWIEAAAVHLSKRSYSEPHWSARRGEAVVFESVSLYGLPLADRRRVSYTRIDPAHSRDLLIRQGLVAGGVARQLAFLEHNLSLVRELLEQEARGRRRGLLVGEERQAELYDQRLPANVASVAQLERWWRKAAEEERQRLFFSHDDLADTGSIRFAEDDYPSQLELRGASFPLKYRFAPGEEDDGISIQVPLGALPALVGEALEWSVPGFFPAVCEQWLKSLPKSKRRHLAPIADKVDELAGLLAHPDRYRQGRLSAALAQAAAELFDVRIDAGDWDRERIDQHLLMNVQVVDAENRLIAQGRDLESLQSRFASDVRARLEDGLEQVEQTGLIRFPDGVSLQGTLVVDDGGGKVAVYPALVDRGDSVDLQALPTEEAQRRANRAGYPRLALLNLGQTARHLRKRAEREQTMGLHFAPLGDARTLQDELLRGAAWYCFFAERPLPHTADEFEQRLRADKARLTQVFETTLQTVGDILERRFRVARLMQSLDSPAYESTLADAGAQLERLVPADLLSATPQAYLPELPRYLDALDYRLRHLQGRVRKDQEMTRVIHGFEERLARLAATPGIAADDADRACQRLRFAVEELRIALFAEPLGTRGKVSEKRLQREFLALERELGLA